MDYATADDVRDALREACQPTQKAWALSHGFSCQFVSDVLSGERDVSANIAEALGYRRLVVFLPCNKRDG